MPTAIMKDRIFETKIVQSIHFGHPVLIETTPIRLAQLMVKGEELHQSVLLHPRYAAESGIGYKLIEVTGLRRERTIEILLDKPIEIDGKEYTILSFKGVGADANNDMVIHPGMWYGCFDHPETWVYRNVGDRYDRYWGALRKDHGTKEFESRELSDLGIPITPHLALNDIPAETVARIIEVEGWKHAHPPGLEGMPPLCQLIRPMTTNVRFEDVIDCVPSLYLQMDIDSITDIDAKAILKQLELIGQGKALKINGRVRQNRLIDGTFIDAENYVIEAGTGTRFIDRLFIATMRLLIMFPDYEARAKKYFEELEEKTGLGFTKRSEVTDVAASRTFRMAAEDAAFAAGF